MLNVVQMSVYRRSMGGGITPHAIESVVSLHESQSVRPEPCTLHSHRVTTAASSNNTITPAIRLYEVM